jgi:Zn-dependent protease
MLTQFLSNPIALVYWLIAFGISLSVHEAAHAWMADRLGDPTARLAGRLTLNPLAHIDPVGTLMLLIAHFGWGKPVPVDAYNLRHPRRDSGLISLAGPAANFILAILLSIILHLSYLFPFIALSLIPIIYLNITWGVFNLLPIHPLDGSHVLVGFLPQETAEKVEQTLEEYGLILLIFLVFPFFGESLVVRIIDPIVGFILKILLIPSPLI